MSRLRDMAQRARPIARAIRARGQLLARALVPRLLRSARRLVTYALLMASTALVLAGVALIYLPAALIGGGLAGFALLTFNPAAARRITWPR